MNNITSPRPVGERDILIVDDDPDIVQAMEAGLAGACNGYGKIYSVGDGNSAISSWDEQRPDVIVLDAILPQRSGFLVLEKIRHSISHDKRRGSWPYIVMITGNPGKRHESWAESLGSDDYIFKPFRLERLAESVQKGLDKDYPVQR